ncbi:MAG: hypothetical protein AAGC68_07230 [Verrucomicrobiota bacterium]
MMASRTALNVYMMSLFLPRIFDRISPLPWRWIIGAACIAALPLAALADDHGDTRQTATTANVDNISGTIDAGDEDWFRIDVTVPGFFAAFVLEQTARVNITVYNEGGSFVAQDPAFDTSTLDGLAITLTAGVYFVQVEGRTSSTEGQYTLELRHPAVAMPLGSGASFYTMRANDIHIFSFSSPPNLPVFHCVGALGNLTISLEPYDSSGVSGNSFTPLFPTPANLNDCDRSFLNGSSSNGSGGFTEYYVVFASNFGSSGTYGLQVTPIGASAAAGGSPTLTYRRPGKRLRGASRHRGTVSDDVGATQVIATMNGVGTRAASISGGTWSVRFNVRKLKRRGKRKTTVIVVATDIRGNTAVSGRRFIVR